MNKINFYIVLFQSRLKPGRMLLVDTKEKKIIQDVELKLEIANSRNHSEWLAEQVCCHGTYPRFKIIIEVFS